MAGFVGTIVAAPVLATTIESFLVIESAEVNVDDDELEAELSTEGMIPTNETESASGYGILTEDGDAILVSTTHAGVLDSEEQNYILDPTWHNHFVTLDEDVEQCGTDPGVENITWQSPGEVEIDDNNAEISDVPTGEFEGWHSITGEELSMTLGEDVSDVVSFRLDPVFDEETGLEAVCVTDITPAEDIDVGQEVNGRESSSVGSESNSGAAASTNASSTNA
ncbi:MAG: hypothetical protein M3307_01170 [Thermoproteota archaeon]|nr:hypothetical protein [Thermoproteota archaeon]